MTLRPPDNQDIVVVGASGDLAARKLLPALYNLEAENLLPEHGSVVGYAVADWDEAAFREHAQEAIRLHSRTGIDEAVFARFGQRLHFVSASAGLGALREVLGCERRLVYLAVPPSAFVELIQGLGGAGLAQGTKLIIEKPFGHDLESATALNQALHEVLDEDCIFRIDHYLGKETVQNLLVFRFGNSIWERLWNRDCIRQVEITVAESLGVENRGAFYEETGAIRDIVQNHMFQLLSVTAMEPPVSFAAEALRNEKVKVLRAVHPLEPDKVLRGQYTAGVIDGTAVPGYREEPGVKPDSQTETFAALRLHIDSWRWSGVPFLLRTGKRMRRRETIIAITFHQAPLHLFSEVGVEDVEPNRMIIRVQPDEGIGLGFIAKQPGPSVKTQRVRMDFSYGSSFKTSPPEAYERLLHDAFDDDHTLFIREDEVERGWAIVQPVLDHPSPVMPYAAGSWGPAEADGIAAPGQWCTMDAV